jgi:hypothetical protein
MKYLIIILTTILVACKPDAPNLEITGYKAGEITLQMAYHDFSPDIVLDTLPDTVTFGGISNLIKIDINQDSLNDIMISAYSLADGFTYHVATDLMPINTDSNKISIYAGNLNFLFTNPSKNEYVSKGFLGKFSDQDVIPWHGNWTLVSDIYNGFPLKNSWFAMAGLNIQGEDMYQNLGDLNWRNTQNAYMGIRWIKDQDTLYGWVRMTVEGYSRIVLHDCAFEKK